MEDLLYDMLQELEFLIGEGKKVPLSSQYMISREPLLALIQEIRENVPDAIERAHTILEKEEQIKEDANSMYQSMVGEAESKARGLELKAKQRAERIINDAQNKAEQIYDDAERKAADIVANAQRKGEELVADHTVLAQAEREAEKLRSDARNDAQREKLSVLNQCETLLRRAEDAAISVANELRDARMSFDNDR